jgi:lysylphosphatidylglycerol synthetase-like protein (DUF2156 family)
MEPIKKNRTVPILLAGMICGVALVSPWLSGLSDRYKLIVAVSLIVAVLSLIISLFWIFYTNRRIARLEDQFLQRLAAYLARTDKETRHAVLAQFETETRDAVLQHLAKSDPATPAQSHRAGADNAKQPGV